MQSNYQHQETRHANLALPVHERIGDLNRRAEGLAPRVAASALDSGCTDTRPSGPRQARAWDMVAEGHSWNAISDKPGQLAEAERCEREGIAYRVVYGGDGYEVQDREAEREPEPRPFSGGQPRCQICHRANHRPGEWQGHHFAYVTEAQVSEAAQREARIITTSGRTGKLTGYQDRHGNPYLAFDDGSEYAIRLDAIREIQAPALQIQCCGTWIDYPAPGQPATCPSCKSVFTAAPDAGESAEAHEQLAREAYAAYVRHNDAAVALRSQAR